MIDGKLIGFLRNAEKRHGRDELLRAIDIMNAKTGNISQWLAGYLDSVLKNGAKSSSGKQFDAPTGNGDGARILPEPMPVPYLDNRESTRRKGDPGEVEKVHDVLGYMFHRLYDPRWQVDVVGSTVEIRCIPPVNMAHLEHKKARLQEKLTERTG